MTVQTDLSTIAYTTNGTAGPFTVPYYFLTNADLVVNYTTAAGVESVLALNVDYTVSGAGVLTGGSITLTPALASGGSLVIDREVNATQETDYTAGDAFPAEAHETALDKVTMLAQQGIRESGRALKFSPHDSVAGNPTLPTLVNRQGYLLAFDETTGDPRASSFTEDEIQSAINAAYSASALAAAVSYTPAGTGAVATTVQAQLRLEVWADNFLQTADTDDAPCIERARAYLTTQANGGVINLSARTYNLSTLSGDALSYSSFISAADNITFRGKGAGKTILKVASGVNATYSSQNKPYIIATGKTSLLKNCIVEGVTFDWNGANNLLTSGYTARNNSSFHTQYGAENCHIRYCEFKETPGNQCVFINNVNYASVPGSGNSVTFCTFKDCGSGLASNYNLDHSSVYIVAKDSFVGFNRFTASQMVNGSCFELHGSGCSAYKNVSDYYQKGFWVASDYADIDNIEVAGGVHVNCSLAFSTPAATYAVNGVKVHDCVFKQATGLTFGSVTYFVQGNTVASQDSLEIDRCVFIGQNYANLRFMQHYKQKHLAFRSNKVTGFNNSTNGYGVIASGLDLGDGHLYHSLVVSNNTFDEVFAPIYFNAALLTKTTVISNNTFNLVATSTVPAVTLGGLTGGIGSVDGNAAASTFTGIADISASSSIRNMQMYGSATYDPPSLVDGAGATTTVTCTGARVGHYASASFSLDLQGILLTAWVSGVDTVSVRFQNESGGTLDLSSGTLRVHAETK